MTWQDGAVVRSLTQRGTAMKRYSAVCLLCVVPTIAIGQTRRIPTPIDRQTFAVMTTFYQYDNDIPLEFKIARREETPLYVREKIVFRSIRDGLVTGYIAVPKSARGPYSVVLLLHGLTGSKEDWWDERTPESGGHLSRALLGAGYAVAMLDVQYHGERVVYNNYDDFGPMVMQRDYSNRYREMFVQTVIDYRRLLDYLSTRKDIDSSRVAVFGYSLGGMMAFALTGTDPRVKVAVAASSPPFQRNPLRAAVAPQNFAPAVNGRPLLMMAGSRDGGTMVEDATALFGYINSETKQLRFFDSEHMLPAEYMQVGVEWIKKYLPTVN